MHAAGASGTPAAADYRHAISRFATGVTVVSTVHDGVRHGMTVSSLTSVSLDPILLLFCCGKDSTLHAPVLAAGQWAVSVLPATRERLGQHFATHAPPGADQFAGQDVVPGPRTGAPVVLGALAWLECRTWATYDGGDHTIVVGEVIGLEIGAEADPLLYYRSDYRALDL